MTLMQIYIGDVHFYQTEWNSSNINETILESPFRINVEFHHRAQRTAEIRDGFDFPATLEEDSPKQYLESSASSNDVQPRTHHSVSKRCAGIGLMGALLPMLLMGLTSLLYSRLLMGGFGSSWGGGQYILVPVYYYDNYGTIYPDYYYYYYYYPTRNSNRGQFIYYDYLTRQQRQQRRVQPLNKQPTRFVYVRSALQDDKTPSVFINIQNQTNYQPPFNLNDSQDHSPAPLEIHNSSLVPRSSDHSSDSTKKHHRNEDGHDLFMKGQEEGVHRAAIAQQRRPIYVQQPQAIVQNSQSKVNPSRLQQQEHVKFQRPAPGHRKQYHHTRAAQPLLRERTPQKAQTTGVARSYVYSPPKVKMAKERNSNGQYNELLRSPQKSYLIRNNKRSGNGRRQTSWLG